MRSINSSIIIKDMSANFFVLPRELRYEIYELCLLHQGPVCPWVDFVLPRGLSPMLLCTNKTVYCEAGSLLYQNRFNFTMAGPGDVSSFLEKIGRNNAAYIQHIHVEFPSFVFSNPESDNVTLEEDDCSILTSIQSSCTNLRTLTTSRSSTSAMEFRLKALDDPKIVTEVLTLVDTRFRAISFLQDIILEAYKQGPSDYIRRQIKNHGWTVVPTGDAGSVGQDFGLYGLGYPRFLAKLGDDSDHGNYDYEYDGDF